MKPPATTNPFQRALLTLAAPALLCLLLLASPALAAEAAIGSFTSVEGVVDVLRGGALPAIPVKLNDPVLVKDVIRTKSGARAVITFRDGNILKLAERSRMDINEYLSDATTIKGVIDLPRGKVHASVEREGSRIAIPQQGNKFEIRTPNAVAGVRGTDYIVSHGRNMTMILVKEGAVAVHNPQTPGAGPTLVTAGNTTTVSQGQAPQPPRPAKAGEIEKHEKDTAPAPKDQGKGGGNADGGDKGGPGDKGAGDTGKAAGPGGAGEPGGGPGGAGGPGGGEGPKGGGLIGLVDTPPVDTPPMDPGKGGVIEPKIIEPKIIEPKIIREIDPTPPPPVATYTYLSNIAAGHLSGTVETKGTLWSATQSSPVDIRTSGNSAPQGVLDIHAADQGWQSGSWTTLLPGGVTHVNSYSNQNLVVDDDHPVTAGLTNSSYSGWGWVSHDYFTNLYPQTKIILTDESNRPTTIEYLYNDTNVLASALTLEFDGSNPVALKNTLAYTLRKAGVMPGYEKVLLIKETEPWTQTVIQDTLASWGISYTVTNSSAFATLDLSPYSAIIIASDQTASFYTNMANNVSRLGNFTASDVPSVFALEISSTNNSNSDKITADGGAYRGYVAGADANSVLATTMYAIYIDPSNNAGILKGSLSGATTLTTWATEGDVYAVKLATSTRTPSQLYESWGDGELEYKFGAIGSGTFTAGGTLSGNALTLEGSDFEIAPGTYTNWGVWATMLSGTYTGSTSDSWQHTISATTLAPNNLVIGAELVGTRWSNGSLIATVRGYWADGCTSCSTPETGIFIGETLGTFNADSLTWQAVQSGVWLETETLLTMAGKIGASPNTAALEQLNIPAVEVGRTTLTGSGNNLTLAMNNVVFLAPSTGAAPTIWATGSVSGTYSAAPTLGTAISLTGSGLTTAFTPTKWASDKWQATVNGGGTYSGAGTLNGSAVQMQGAAAGTYGGGSLSGTAAGTVK